MILNIQYKLKPRKGNPQVPEAWDRENVSYSHKSPGRVSDLDGAACAKGSPGTSRRH